MGFGSDRDHDCAHGQHDSRENRHRHAISKAMAHDCLNVRARCGEQYADLVRESRKESAKTIRRELIDTRRNYAPRPLHRELHQKRTR